MSDAIRIYLDLQYGKIALVAAFIRVVDILLTLEKCSIRAPHHYEVY